MKYRQQFILVESKKFACWEPLKRKIHICISNPRVLSLIEALLGQTKHIHYKVFLSLFLFSLNLIFLFVSFVSYSICVNQDWNRVTYTEYFYRDHIVIHFIFLVVVVVLYTSFILWHRKNASRENIWLYLYKTNGWKATHFI